jgi:transposase
MGKRYLTSSSISPSVWVPHPWHLKLAAVRLVVEKGWSVSEAAAWAQMSRSWLSECITKYERGGKEALALYGYGALLSHDEERQVLGCIVQQTPDVAIKAKMRRPEYSLWSWTAVRDLVRNELNITLSRTSTVRYLAAWGLWHDPPSFAGRLAQRIAYRFKTFHRLSTSMIDRCSANVSIGWIRTPVTKTRWNNSKRFAVLTAVLRHRVQYFAVYNRRYDAGVLHDFLTRLDSEARKSVDIALLQHRIHTKRNLVRKVGTESSDGRLIVIHNSSDVLDVFEL